MFGLYVFSSHLSLRRDCAAAQTVVVWLLPALCRFFDINGLAQIQLDLAVITHVQKLGVAVLHRGAGLAP